MVSLLREILLVVLASHTNDFDSLKKEKSIMMCNKRIKNIYTFIIFDSFSYNKVYWKVVLVFVLFAMKAI